MFVLYILALLSYTCASKWNILYFMFLSDADDCIIIWKLSEIDYLE